MKNYKVHIDREEYEQVINKEGGKE